jgi:hypothetical protein
MSAPGAITSMVGGQQGAGGSQGNGGDQDLIAVPASLWGKLTDYISDYPSFGGGARPGGILGGKSGNGTTQAGGVSPASAGPTQSSQGQSSQGDDLILVPAGLWGSLIGAVGGLVGNLVGGSTGQTISQISQGVSQFAPFSVIPGGARAS